MSHTALLFVKGDFHQVYTGIKEHHNRHHLQGSRMFETDCDCRLRLQYFEDAKHVKELFQMVRKQLRIINARLQMRYPSRNHSNRNATHLVLLGGFGGMLPRENFLKRCNLVRFRVYFDQILSLFFFKKCHFLYEK